MIGFTIYPEVPATAERGPSFTLRYLWDSAPGLSLASAASGYPDVYCGTAQAMSETLKALPEHRWHAALLGDPETDQATILHWLSVLNPSTKVLLNAWDQS